MLTLFIKRQFRAFRVTGSITQKLVMHPLPSGATVEKLSEAGILRECQNVPAYFEMHADVHLLINIFIAKTISCLKMFVYDKFDKPEIRLARERNDGR